MGVRVIPLGYGTPSAMAQLEALMQDEHTALIDTRYSPRARRAEWRQGVLQARYGKRYMWLGETLGNINFNNDGPIQLAQPEQGLARLVNGLRAGWSLVLLCQCPDYEQCHRKVIVDLLLSQLPELEVIHPEVVQTHSLPALSIWQPYAFMLANPDVLIAISYQDEALHTGNIYRFDSWERLGRSRSGTDRRSGRIGRSKTIWVWCRDWSNPNVSRSSRLDQLRRLVDE